MQGDYNADLLENVYSMKSRRGGFTCYDVLSNSVLYISSCSHCSVNIVSAISITAGECVSVDTHRLRRVWVRLIVVLVGATDEIFIVKLDVAKPSVGLTPSFFTSSWCNRPLLKKTLT